MDTPSEHVNREKDKSHSASEQAQSTVSSSTFKDFQHLMTQRLFSCLGKKKQLDIKAITHNNRGVAAMSEKNICHSIGKDVEALKGHSFLQKTLLFFLKITS